MNEEKPLIYSKIIAIMNQVGAIKKNQQASQYKYRGIDDLYNHLHPLFAKNGVFITSTKINAEREERKTKNGGAILYSIMDYEFRFWAEDGSYISSTITGEAMDSSDKSSNKAISQALKYALMQMFLIPVDENLDTETSSPEEIQTKKEPEKKEPDKKKILERVNQQKTVADLDKAEKYVKENLSHLWIADDEIQQAFADKRKKLKNEQ